MSVCYLLWSTVVLLNNYVTAARIGLPVIVIPINPHHPLWLMSQSLCKPLLHFFPRIVQKWAFYSEPGWQYTDRYSIHARLGTAFTSAHPGGIDLFLADPGATDDVTRRRNDFVKDPANYGYLETYGPNLDTVNGKQWDRHRKITVPPFNENNSALVWRETGEQTEQMLEQWQARGEIYSTQADIHSLALNVLCNAGFGLSTTFIDDQSTKSALHGRHKFGYRESLRILLFNFIQLVVLGILSNSGIPTWMMPSSMKRILVAKEEFRGYMQEMLAKEKAAFEQGDLSRHNLMSNLVRSSEQSKAASRTGKEHTNQTHIGLSDDEVYGNLFIYNLAGHETTAVTMHFAIMMLAIFPEWQEWIALEIDMVRNNTPSGDCYYEDIFPKLRRCLALAYETVRLYGPVVTMPRLVTSYQPLTISDREYILPPKTAVHINFSALHTSPDSWGPDPLTFRPSRWIPSRQVEGLDSTCNELVEPLQGSFIAWNHGPRVCPGKKFSQVEITRVLFSLFANGSRVELVQEAGESVQQARERALRTVKNAKLEFTLKMYDTERVGFRWTKKPKI